MRRFVTFWNHFRHAIVEFHAIFVILLVEDQVSEAALFLLPRRDLVLRPRLPQIILVLVFARLTSLDFVLRFLSLSSIFTPTLLIFRRFRLSLPVLALQFALCILLGVHQYLLLVGREEGAILLLLSLVAISHANACSTSHF